MVSRPIHARTCRAAAALLAVLVSASFVGVEEAFGQALDRVKVFSILREGSIPAGQEKAFEDYVKKLLSQFIMPANISRLPELRDDLGTYFRNARGGAAGDKLADLVLGYMQKVVLAKTMFGENETQNRSIRLNAILVIGDLSPAKSVSTLQQILSWNGARDYMRVAALIGIVKQATTGGIPADRLPKLQPSLIAILKQPQAPAGWDPNAYAWMRRLAGQALGAIGNPDPAVIDALATVVRDSKSRPAMRCDMAQYLGQLKFVAGGKTDVKALANSVGHETLELCKAEMETAESTKRDPQRRFLSYVLTSAMMSLEGGGGRNGLLGGASGDTQKFVDGIRLQVKTLLTSVDNPETTLTPEMLKGLEDALEPLPAAAAPVQAAAAPAAPEAKSAGR